MKTTVLCLCLASTICAAPMKSLYEYLPQPGGPVQPPQRNGPFSALPQMPQNPGLTGPVSMEIVFIPKYTGQNGGGQQPGGAFQTQPFLKYKFPKAPGRKSVEILYPMDFAQQQQMTSIFNGPALPPNFFPFGYMPPTMPQQNQQNQQNQPNQEFPGFLMPQQGAQEAPQPQQPAQPVQVSPPQEPAV